MARQGTASSPISNSTSGATWLPCLASPRHTVRCHTACHGKEGLFLGSPLQTVPRLPCLFACCAVPLQHWPRSCYLSYITATNPAAATMACRHLLRCTAAAAWAFELSLQPPTVLLLQPLLLTTRRGLPSPRLRQRQGRHQLHTALRQLVRKCPRAAGQGAHRQAGTAHREAVGVL